MYPERKRFRIIRIRKKSIITLQLDQLSSPLRIKCLYVRRVSPFKAWAKIKSRCAQLVDVKAFTTKPLMWRLYNKIQLYQRVNSSLFTYSQWRKVVETSIQTKLDSIKVRHDDLVEFIPVNNLSRALKAHFVVPSAPRDIFSEYLTVILGLICQKSKKVKVLYGDNDLFSDTTMRDKPSFRPAWNRELFWSTTNYANGWIIDASLWNTAYERLLLQESRFSFQRLLLEILHDAESTFGSQSIVHVPFVLCSVHLQNYSYYSSSEYLQKTKLDLQNFFQAHRADYPEFQDICSNPTETGLSIQWSTPQESLLSIIIPTRDSVSILSNCIKSIYSHDPGIPIEIVVVDNGSINHETAKYLDSFSSRYGPGQTRQHVLRHAGPFNYSYLNNLAVPECRGNSVLLLNNDTEFITDDWGYRLASNSLRPGIGCVGAKLLFPDNTVQHAGVVLGVGGIAGHAFKYYACEASSHCSRLQLSQEYAAVTAACLAISRQNWKELGGLDNNNLHVNYNDVDLCLRSLAHGLRNLYLPDVMLYHYESKTRGKPSGPAYSQWKREQKYMLKRWHYLLKNDPYYHPCLTLDSEDWGIWLIEHNKIARLPLTSISLEGQRNHLNLIIQ